MANPDEIILKSIKGPVGELYAGKIYEQIPFAIKEFYFIRNVPDGKIARGMHAHKKREQVIFCLLGSFTLHMDDGNKKWSVAMNDPARGMRLKKRVWHSMTDFSKDCVILVVADDFEDASDYIRDYDEFLKFVKI
ncbi:hypothetical protein A2661_00520 [Candidatus Giovannonibacteria bacterium RIFCSPHIGHO2_01_FULL_45_24]|uniref:Sugar 3,4-ketoisomerase QdtA cupin domain-containing protein n=1 Tax=Candidatus Giovannonibacteria bacterium RIFCSPLOWO2_01_FULL_46_32 TaxID=1798353 RepID=A0A1F5XHV2_9BACT|nr:MAG: hypothetical protein A2661_00520 [Candidatus Giovannonibacteria bacterium RIFCSPHIGHO2_01_FULL_45_24]OGF87061.1 MAG: hypothetical protein A3B19_01360 [Candidatus Giovannonibacteria bacterium RIFCSPLOWO2_01_FULL_46_32]